MSNIGQLFFISFYFFLVSFAVQLRGHLSTNWRDELVYWITSAVVDIIEYVSRKGHFRYFNLFLNVYFSMVVFKVCRGNDFFYCFHFVAFLNSMIRELGLSFCIDKVLSMFFKSFVENSVCPPYVKFHAVSAWQFINSLSAFFFMFTSFQPPFLSFSGGLYFCPIWNSKNNTLSGYLVIWLCSINNMNFWFFTCSCSINVKPWTWQNEHLHLKIVKTELIWEYIAKLGSEGTYLPWDQRFMDSIPGDWIFFKT